MTLFASYLIGCSGEVTEEELRLWKNTESGQKKVQEVIKDVKQPETIRLKAIEVLIENELSYKALDAIKESPDSLKLINGIKGWLLGLLNKEENMQKIARDMCILFLDYVKDKDKNLHKEIGEEIGERV